MSNPTVIILAVLLMLAARHQCTVVAQINGTTTSFESGTLPFERYDEPIFSIYGNLTNYDDPDVNGKIVTIPFEFDADLMVYDLEQRGAIGAIIMTTQLPVGWTFNFYRWQHRLRIPQVSVYYTDYGTISTALFTNVSMISSHPNEWQVVFNRANILAMTAIFCSIFFVLLCVAVWAFVDSVMSTDNSTKKSVFTSSKARKAFWAVNNGLLAIECVFYFFGSIDYNGTAGIYGYLAANLIAFTPVEISYANIWLFVIYMLDIMYKKTLSVTGFVERKALYIALAIISFSIGMVSILLTLFVRGTLATAIPATMISGGHQIASGIIFIVVSSLLIRKCKKSQTKINKRMLYNWTALGIIIFLHGVVVLTLLAYFNSPVGNSIFYWLLRCFDAAKTFCFLYPFISRRIVKSTEASSSGTSNTSSHGSITVTNKLEMETQKDVV